MVEEEKTEVVEEVVEEKNPIDEAKSVLLETKKTLEEIKKERQKLEKATAESLINGKSYAGQKQTPKISEEELKAKERIKAVGLATGAQWAKEIDNGN